MKSAIKTILHKTYYVKAEFNKIIKLNLKDIGHYFEEYDRQGALVNFTEYNGNGEILLNLNKLSDKELELRVPEIGSYGLNYSFIFFSEKLIKILVCDGRNTKAIFTYEDNYRECEITDTFGLFSDKWPNHGRHTKTGRLHMLYASFFSYEKTIDLFKLKDYIDKELYDEITSSYNSHDQYDINIFQINGKQLIHTFRFSAYNEPALGNVKTNQLKYPYQREIVGKIHYENDNILGLFKYDSKENWIERIDFENDVIPVEMIEREIKYYKSYKSAVASLDSLK